MAATRIAIIGNAGAGKSTLARHLAERRQVPVLDLDTIAWRPEQQAFARPPDNANADVQRFCRTHPGWVVEGCYANLVAAALAFGPVLLFLDPGVAQCMANCIARPWEPHKYATRTEQDATLAFLLTWVSEYDSRSGELSRAGHEALFAAYRGRKHRVRALPDIDLRTNG